MFYLLVILFVIFLFINLVWVVSAEGQKKIEKADYNFKNSC